VLYVFKALWGKMEKFEDTIGETVNRRTDNTMAKKGTNTQTKNDL
jgi:hypothetical protein